MSEQRTLQTRTAKPVWDRFVRFFHWSLVACVLLNYGVVEEGEDLHHWLGYAASALVASRLVWGFVGSAHARFSNFFPTTNRLQVHIADLYLGLRTGQFRRHEGHNPLGALMMLLLMALVLLLGLTGWLQTTDRFWGVEWLQDVHEVLADTLIISAGLHAAAAVVMGRLEKTSLVRAMFTGVKVYK
jgi:cytochrome b